MVPQKEKHQLVDTRKVVETNWLERPLGVTYNFLNRDVVSWPFILAPKETNNYLRSMGWHSRNMYFLEDFLQLPKVMIFVGFINPGSLGDRLPKQRLGPN